MSTQEAILASLAIEQSLPTVDRLTLAFSPRTRCAPAIESEPSPAGVEVDRALPPFFSTCVVSDVVWRRTHGSVELSVAREGVAARAEAVGRSPDAHGALGLVRRR